MFTHEQLHSSQGHRLTRSLFKETARPGDTPIMTLSRNEKDGLVQLAPLYHQHCVSDPSEYEFAVAVFGTHAHWRLIAESSWMKPYIEEWRMEAAIARKSIAFRTLCEDAAGSSRSATASAKYLIEEPWKNKRVKEVRDKSQSANRQAAETVKGDVARLAEYLPNKQA